MGATIQAAFLKEGKVSLQIAGALVACRKMESRLREARAIEIALNTR
jgi:hypothetical protein